MSTIWDYAGLDENQVQAMRRFLSQRELDYFDSELTPGEAELTDIGAEYMFDVQNSELVAMSLQQSAEGNAWFVLSIHHIAPDLDTDDEESINSDLSFSITEMFITEIEPFEEDPTQFFITDRRHRLDIGETNATEVYFAQTDEGIWIDNGYTIYSKLDEDQHFDGMCDITDFKILYRELGIPSDPREWTLEHKAIFKLAYSEDNMPWVEW